MGAPAGCTEIHSLTINLGRPILGSRRDRRCSRARWAGRCNPSRGQGYPPFLKCSFPHGWNCLTSKSMSGCASMEDPTSGSPYDALRISGRVVYPTPLFPRRTHIFLTSQCFYNFHALRHTARTPDVSRNRGAEQVLPTTGSCAECRCPAPVRSLVFCYLAASLRARAIAALTPFFARRARTSAFALDLSCLM